MEDLGAGGLWGGVFGIAGGLIALGVGDRFGVAERHAGCSVQNTADGPNSFVAAFCVGALEFREKDFAGALLFGAVVPAAEEGEMVAQRGQVGWGGGFLFEGCDQVGGAEFGAEG